KNFMQLMYFVFCFVFSSEMGPLTAIIFLAALIHQSAGQVRIVDQHNEIRRSVIPTASNMLKMTWNEKAAANAQKWANKCQMKISPRKERIVNGVPCGENILQSTYPSTWAETIKVWHSQKYNFKYGVGSIKKTDKIQSYTQLISYNSYQVGCATAYCPNSQFPFMRVCHYCPSGNNPMQITKPYKKGPKCGDCPGHCDHGLCTNPCKYQDLFTNCAHLRIYLNCNLSVMSKNCRATCKCATEIK
uniref:ShKT domain-containing protein n=1 Tax=Apteryx owenii TaxID=8824 RepID=A0A8B9PVJ8_APTOW